MDLLWFTKVKSKHWFGDNSKHMIHCNNKFSNKNNAPKLVTKPAQELHKLNTQFSNGNTRRSQCWPLRGALHARNTALWLHPKTKFTPWLMRQWNRKILCLWNFFKCLTMAPGSVRWLISWSASAEAILMKCHRSNANARVHVRPLRLRTALAAMTSATNMSSQKLSWGGGGSSLSTLQTNTPQFMFECCVFVRLTQVKGRTQVLNRKHTCTSLMSCIS